MPFTKKSQVQLTVLSVVLIFSILFYTVRMYSIQIANAAEYTDKNDGAASVRTAVLKAPRGEIFDYCGRKIAVNRDGYNIVFNKAYVGDDINDVILSLITLLSKNNTEWKDDLPLNISAPYGFQKDGDTEKLIKKLELAHYATPENCMSAMVKKYKLEKYSTDDRRKIAGVRYSMDIADFSISYPYTFAEDISTELMRKISESSFALSGVSVEVVPFRQYLDTSLAVNIIGSVGPIFAEDWDKYKEKGYSYNDKVGKSGIEKWGEDYLRGTDGEITYRIDKNGNILSSEVTRAPVAGKTIMLTLDKNMQRTAQNALADIIKELQKENPQAKAGAAVVMDIKNASVLCAANYPTYDAATINKDYDKLKDDPAKPLTNRAFQGVYQIGSTIKPAVAVAAMESDLYHIGETVYCQHTYKLFNDYRPSCMGFHRATNLNLALSKSCNYFFFEMGRRIGATRLTDYYKQFGLGVKTGVEVDDSAGLLFTPKSDGTGDTLQIAIGQLSAFTPLQLANYAATLANGGTRYKPTLIEKIVSYDINTVFDDNEPEVLNTISIKKATLDAVKQGMLSVTEEGTASKILKDYPIKVGGKTGTSQVEGKEDNSVFIAFAPFDNPEIAISVVLENGNSGVSAGNVVRRILDAYFFTSYSDKNSPAPFTVLE